MQKSIKAEEICQHEEIASLPSVSHPSADTANYLGGSVKALEEELWMREWETRNLRPKL